MIEIALAATIAAAVLTPHVLPLGRVGPLTAAAVWLSALALRALVAIGGAVFVFLYLPEAGVVRAIGDWCWHELLPVIAETLGFSGHPVSHAAVAVPAVAIAASVLWLLFGLARAWLALRRKLGRALGEGPLGSLIVPDERILVGVTRLGRGRIVVSDRALGALDEDELRASLNHELGHIRRRHRSLLLGGSILSAVGRPLPGTRAVEAQLILSLERDADEFAVERTRDPLALASAICKAAGATASPLLTALGGRGSVSVRLRYLLDGAETGSVRLERTARGLALLLVSLTLAVAAGLPAWVLASPAAAGAVASGDLCQHAH